jgi:hypothetical protein
LVAHAAEPPPASATTAMAMANFRIAVPPDEITSPCSN